MQFFWPDSVDRVQCETVFMLSMLVIIDFLEHFCYLIEELPPLCTNTAVRETDGGMGATTGGSGVRTSPKFGRTPNFLHSFLTNRV